MQKAVGAVAVLALTTGVLGCLTDQDIPRSDITILSLNGGDALQSDVYNFGEDNQPGGGDDYPPEDEVWVTFHNVPSDAQGPSSPNGAFSDVTFERYRVTFTSNAATAIDQVVGGMHAVVKSGDSSGVAVVLVPADLKLRSPLFELRSGGEVLSTAHMEFWGKEKTSNDDIHVDAFITVNFAEFGDEN